MSAAPTWLDVACIAGIVAAIAFSVGFIACGHLFVRPRAGEGDREREARR